MANLQLTFTPDYDDYWAVNKAATFNLATIILIALMGIISVLTLLALALGWLSLDSDRLLLYLFPPAMFIFFLLYTPINLRRHARQSAEQSGEINWQVSPRVIAIEAEGESAKHTWEAFTFVQELPGQFIFFFKANRSNYVFITKNAFASTEQETALRDLITANLGAIH